MAQIDQCEIGKRQAIGDPQVERAGVESSDLASSRTRIIE
jgi:hypothetical protein